MKFKRVFSLILVIALLGGVGVGFAASAGSSGDPFISLSFLLGNYQEKVLSQAEDKIDSALESAFKQAASGLGGGDTGSFQQVNVKAGGEVRLNFGGSAILQSGAAVLTVVQGEVINVTEGYSTSGGNARIGYRYMAAENSVGSLKFSADSVVLLDGDAKVLSGEGEASPFTDIFPNDWFYADVVSAVKMGLINGMTDTTYVPGGSITHAQVIKLAACTHQKYHEGTVTLANGEPWYQTYVDYALANGIISSAPAEMDAACSRAYYIAVMYGAMPKREYAEINTVADDAIPDVKQGHAYYDAIYGFYRAGIVIGNDAQGTFSPDSNVKRSEVATLVARMFDENVRKTISLP